MTDFLAIVAHELRRHRHLAERAVAALDDDAFFSKPAPSVNSVAIVVKHLAGNLRSRWSDFLVSDGEKSDRRRDDEFALGPEDSRDALWRAWHAGWTILVDTLGALRPTDLDRVVTIRGEPHSVAEALARGTTHVAYHTGQVLFIARMLRPDAPWVTVAPKASGTIRGAYLASSTSPAPASAGPASLPTAPTPDPRIDRVLETAIYSDDLPRAASFYQVVLGLRPMGRSERVASFDAGASTVLLVFARGASLGGIRFDGGPIPPHDGAGPAHLAFAIASTDLERWRTRLVAAGIAIESEVRWERGGRSVYFRDPDGHSVELATPGVWAVY